MRYQSENQYTRICELLDGGDWACAFGQCGTLSYVCQKLATLLEDPELVAKACDVAREANRDLDTATRQWGELSSELRHSPMAWECVKPERRSEHRLLH